MSAGRPSKVETLSRLPERLDRGEPRESLLGFVQQALFGFGSSEARLRGGASGLLGVDREAVGDERAVGWRDR